MVVVVVEVVVVVVVCRCRGGTIRLALTPGDHSGPFISTGILVRRFRGLGTSSAHDRPTVMPGERRG